MTGARVIVVRNSDEDARDRQIVVNIDGEQMATLMFGQKAQREIEPGKHRLRAHNTLVWKTIDFEVQAGETARFSVINRPGKGTFGLLSLIGARPLYLDVRRDPEQ